MELFDRGIDVSRGLALAARVHPKYRPVFEAMPEHDQAALALYFLPHRSQKDVLEVTRPRVVKWYCPFADQRQFPSGHRYCINVYTGCEHGCQYCYAAGYADRAANCKNTFRTDLVKDLDALDSCQVPPAPVHVSNSTDPLQPLELEHRHTLYTLEKLVERRHRFTTVAILTKNPSILVDDKYIRLLQQLNELPADHPAATRFRENGWSSLRVECSLAFYSDEARQLLDPTAPDVASRIEAIRFLRQEGIPVILRIDPLFPRDQLPGGKSMADFGLSDLQPIDDLQRLIQFAREVDVCHLVYSVAKITRPKFGPLLPVMAQMKQVYEHLSSDKPLVCRGGSWRLPDDVAQRLVVKPFLDLCRQQSIIAKMCKENLLSTP